MASLLSRTVVQDGVMVATDASEPAYVPDAFVTVFIDNNLGAGSDEDLTFKLQAAHSATAGLNELDASLPDSGVTWFDYYSWEAAAVPTLTVNAGDAIAFDMSNFAPVLLRVVCLTDQGSGSEAQIIVQSFGPN